MAIMLIWPQMVINTCAQDIITRKKNNQSIKNNPKNEVKRNQREKNKKKHEKEKIRQQREADTEPAAQAVTPTKPQLGAVFQDLINNMVHVEGGTFIMGDSTKRNTRWSTYLEAPAHQVTVSSFSIGKYEVTQKEWCAVMGSNPSSFIGDNLPVNSVSWIECQIFIDKLNTITGMSFRLPTEAEWEFAARGGNKSRGYMYAGSNIIESIAWFKDNGQNKIHPVGSKSPNELGLYDMSGNVWEWCYDWFKLYDSSTQHNPVGPSSGETRVVRGGSFCNEANQLQILIRYGSGPNNHNNYQGFRLVCEL